MKLLTLYEVSTTLKVSDSTVRRLIKGGILKAYKIGPRGQLRIREEELEGYLENRVVKVDASVIKKKQTHLSKKR